MRDWHKIAMVAGVAAFCALVLGIYKIWPIVRTFIPLPVAKAPIQTDGSYRTIIFLHHSTGARLIAEGQVRHLFSELGYEFWDHGYNHLGLVNPDGDRTGTSYRIPGNRGRGNTDVDGLAALFKQPVTDPPANAFSRLLQHEVIIVKSCFPNSAIEDEAMQQQFKAWYLEMRDVIDQHPERIFIILTSPPLHPLATNAEQAVRARAIANWLKSDAYLAGRNNLYVFDFFDRLADPATNMLRAEYQLDSQKADSHPNRQANEVIAPRFVAFVNQAVETYQAP